MIVLGTDIIMGVNHSEMTGKFMDEVMNVAGKKSVAGIQAHSYIRGVDTIENP